jgi:hypothetical protein
MQMGFVATKCEFNFRKRLNNNEYDWAEWTEPKNRSGYQRPASKDSEERAMHPHMIDSCMA